MNRDEEEEQEDDEENEDDEFEDDEFEGEEQRQKFDGEFSKPNGK